jgi:hypothetical protein
VIELVAPPGEHANVTSILATNVFELTDGGWRMVIHHAAPAPAEAQQRREEAAPASHTLH